MEGKEKMSGAEQHAKRKRGDINRISRLSLWGMQIGYETSAVRGKEEDWLFILIMYFHPGHMTMKERVCSPDIELVAVGLRPHYMPREFSHTILITVCILPSVNSVRTCDLLHSVTARLQIRHPDTLYLISADFNHAYLTKTFPTFTHYVDCPTRGYRTLDLMYSHVKGAYSSSAFPPLGRSDHYLIYLLPEYTALVKRQPANVRKVSKWYDEANSALQEYLEATNWEVCCEPLGQNTDRLTDFPNNKHWVTKGIKAVLNDKKCLLGLETERKSRELKDCCLSK
ncbi:hypothetical protein QTP70_016045 [Hemibagrus guttatus]|uniref:Uncharacterized protein n=1 Tax=Hemibagrus guttatus TaxID=175788 RepID=A0AAE0UJF5_9TELE|nr:hypothetical protein QTP70_016045 [Hemibagrus guttatus]